MHRRMLSLALMAVLSLSLPAFAAEKKGRTVDLFWTAPDLAAYPATSIALMPVVTYDNNAEAQRLVEAALGQVLRTSGHRWISPSLTRDWLAKAGGDSLAKAFKDALLKSPRIDSTQAPYFSRVARARALLTVRVDQFEKRLLEINQSGRPATTVQLRAALVDSTGRLLWTASGGETLEGPYQDPNANPIGVNASGLNNAPIMAQGGAPDFREVLTKVLTRWAEAFPKKPVADSTAAK